MARFKYKLIDICTLKGLEEAERLHQEGWKMIASSPFSIQFEKEVLTEREQVIRSGRY